MHEPWLTDWPDGLSLVLDEDLVHADLVCEEPALSAGGGQLEVGVDGAGGADHLGRDGVLVKVALKHVDLEGTLQAREYEILLIEGDNRIV